MLFDLFRQMFQYGRFIHLFCITNQHHCRVLLLLQEQFENVNVFGAPRSVLVEGLGMVTRTVLIL
jgi:hypothetical protein